MKAPQVDYVSIEELLDHNDNFIMRFELDMENGDYKRWVEEYPNGIETIFGSLIMICGNDLNENDIKYFIDRGLDLNVTSSQYPSDAGGSTPLGSACEYRYDNLVKLLIENGADVNLIDQCDFTPLESTLIGHSYNDQFETESCEKIVKLLINKGAKNKIHKYILDDFCEDYIKNSVYLKNLLKESKLIN